MENGEAEERAAAAAPERQVMRWDSFLPRRSLQVLLVEGDDSTRHIVTALLRKCNYRVAGVADGMKAWEVMKEKNYGFDLVLTEVATPSLSGIGLLTKIMSTDECKNIPVIMMSAQDSVNVVLKCMLKGAVDFLVKPVRKNELRNLWQHVWRRHSSNSYTNVSDQNTASNQISANVCGQSKTGENSDEKSDAHSSGSQRDTEIESTQNLEEPPRIEDIRATKEEAVLDSSHQCEPIKESVSNMEIDIQMGPGVSVLETSTVDVNQEGQPNNIILHREDNPDPVRFMEGNDDDSELEREENVPGRSVENTDIFVERMSNEQSSYAILQKDSLIEDRVNVAAKTSYVNDASTSGTSALWELSLRRPESNGYLEPELKGKHVLKHSVASAFSRYSGEKRTQLPFHKSVSSDLCISNKESAEEYHSFLIRRDNDTAKDMPFLHSDIKLSYPRANEGETTVHFHVSSTDKENVQLQSPSAENNRAGHPSNMEGNNIHCPQVGFIPLPLPLSVGAIPYPNLCAGYGGILHPVLYPEASLAPHSSAVVRRLATQASPAEHSVHNNNHLVNNASSMEYHRCELTDQPGHWRRAIDISEPADSRKFYNHREQPYQSGSCSQDVLRGSQSNCSGETADGVGNTGTALESGNESGAQNCNRKVLDCDRARREAALVKFRMKRKDRCFEKKVRYHSRKKLAEQRPRIKGQFVRQKVPDAAAIAETDS